MTPLAAINRQYNRQINYVADADRYRTAEFWTPAESLGDCEDYALAKLHACLKAGYPLASLRLATCWAIPGDPDSYHAVLVVEQGGEQYVLDNRFDEVFRATDSDYVWDRIQKTGGQPEWVKAF